MALTSLTTADGNSLPAQATAEFLKIATEGSVATRLGTVLPITGSGAEFYVQTQAATPQFVDEGGVKPFGDTQFERKRVNVHKIVVGETFTEEFIEDDSYIYDAVVRQFPALIANKIDEAIFTGVGVPSDFGTLAGIATASGTGVYNTAVDAFSKIGTAGGDLNGWVSNGAGEALLLGDVDSTGRPLFISNPSTDGSVGSLLGRPIHKSNALPENTSLIGGDWSALKIGLLNSVNIRISKEGVVNGVSLFETNQVGVIAEIRIASYVTDKDKFVAIASGGSVIPPVGD